MRSLLRHETIDASMIYVCPAEGLSDQEFTVIIPQKGVLLSFPISKNFPVSDFYFRAGCSPQGQLTLGKI